MANKNGKWIWKRKNPTTLNPIIFPVLQIDRTTSGSLWHTANAAQPCGEEEEEEEQGEASGTGRRVRVCCTEAVVWLPALSARPLTGGFCCCSSAKSSQWLFQNLKLESEKQKWNENEMREKKKRERERQRWCFGSLCKPIISCAVCTEDKAVLCSRHGAVGRDVTPHYALCGTLQCWRGDILCSSKSAAAQCRAVQTAVHWTMCPSTAWAQGSAGWGRAEGAQGSNAHESQERVHPILVLSAERCDVFIEGMQFPVVFCFAPFQRNVFTWCLRNFFWTSAALLFSSHQPKHFLFFEHSKTLLNQTHADRQICFIFIGKTQWKQRYRWWKRFGEGTEAEWEDAPSQADANNAPSEAHNEPIENTELFGKIPNCEKYAHVAVESQVGTSDTRTYFFKCTFLLQIQRQGTVIII